MPAIVAPELWEVAQRQHGTRRFGVGRSWDSPYLLSGLIRCDHCGKHYWANKQGRGRERASITYAAATCPSGLAVCDGLRVPVSYLDTAVLDGIQKRLERILDRTTLRERVVELLQDEAPAVPPEALEEQLDRVRRKIARLVEALASGPEDLPSVRGAVAALERERARLERDLATAQVERRSEGPVGLQATVDQLLESLQGFRQVLRAGSPAERRQLVRTFLAEVRVQKATRQAVLRWYRLPRNLSAMLVELRGAVLDGVHVEALALPRSAWARS